MAVRDDLGELESDAALARWQAARLAAIGMGLSKFAHDLRGIFAPALLAAERLQSHSDPAVRRSGDVLVRAVERANESLGGSLATVRAGLPVLRREQVALATAISQACPDSISLSESIPDQATVQADPAFMRQAWEAVFAHFGAVGVTRVQVTAAGRLGDWALVCHHDARLGPDGDPLSDVSVRGLAVARELMRACGGDLLVQGEAGLAVTFRH